MSADPSDVGFSVVIPTHDSRASVRRAVESVLAQTHGPLEVVVVCDGDGRGTRAVLDGLGDERVRIVEQSHEGPSAARNHGARLAEFAFVTFLDDDDEARPLWLATAASAAERECGTGVITWGVAFREHGVVVNERDCRLLVGDRTTRGASLLAGGYAVRTDVFQEIGGYDTSLTYSENLDLGFRLLDHVEEHGIPVVHVADPLVDLNRQPARVRADRYRSAPGRAAAIILDRHAARFRGDGSATASFLRLIAAAERHEGRRGRAIRTAVRAVGTHPAGWQNYRTLAVSLLPPSWNAATLGLPRRPR